MLNKNYREDFPIFQQTMNGKPLIYLDSSATSQKPQSVIHALENYYRYENANIHRGVYQLSARATELYEQTRLHVKKFINAASAQEIIFVRGATEAINLVAQCYSRLKFQANDEVIISAMEHHSNIVPWQMLKEQYGIVLRVIPITDNGEIDLVAYQELFNSRTKLVAVAHASNVLGTINPIKQMIDIAHAHNAVVLIDGAQAFPHLSVDVQQLDCDFYVFSAHKAYGPTGLGVLYGKRKLLEEMPPYQGGGDMIEQVSFEKTTYNKLPGKFEAGTPNIAAVIAFDKALQYLDEIGMENVAAHEQSLLLHATDALLKIPDLKIIGTAAQKLGVISFVFDTIHPHDIGTILDLDGIAVRVGHHCAMPLMERFKVPATVRVSFGLYNNFHDIDALLVGLHQVKRVFA